MDGGDEPSSVATKVLSYKPNDFGTVKVEITSDQYDETNDVFVPDTNGKISGTYKIKQIEPRNNYNFDELDVAYIELIHNTVSLGRVNSPSINSEQQFEIDTSGLTENSTLKASLLFDIYSRVTYPQVGQRQLVASQISGDTNAAVISITN